MNSLVISLCGMAIPVILVPTVLGIRLARQQRDMEHLERMKALELGRRLPRDERWETAPRLALSIGAGVPIGVFACAWFATTAVGFHDGIWVGAAMVGCTAVISGTILAVKHFAGRDHLETYASPKPVVDADAFDVVGSRG